MKISLTEDLLPSSKTHNSLYGIIFVIVARHCTHFFMRLEQPII